MKRPALALLCALGASTALAAPKIERVEPDEGPVAGGTRVIVHGSGFAPGAVVTFEGVPARDVKVLGPGRIEALTPALKSRASATVTVENPDGTVGERNDAFTFYGPYDWLRVWGLVGLILLLVSLGAPLFVILAGVALYCFGIYLEWPSAYPTFLDQFYAHFNPFVDAMYRTLTSNEALLAIPFFILSGEIMTAGSIAEKLVNFAKALVGWLPGGMAIAAVGACMFFAAISGSSPVTVIAIGSIMYPALVREKYPESFSLGLVTTAGSLGILIPPSIPMIVYVIMVGGGFKVEEMFKAGIGPGLLIGTLLMAYSFFVALRTPALVQALRRPTFAEWRRNVWAAFTDGFWALLLPVVILGGIYGGAFSATAAGVVSVGYAYLVETWIHRDVRHRDLPRILAEAAVLMGSILIILTFAFAFNYFLTVKQIPNAAAAWLGSLDLGPVGFMLVLNGILLVVGCLMDIMSAIMILAPLVAPMAATMGIDPIHLGIVFIVNLEIGYLTPPIGLNLFVACTLFRKSFGEVIRAVVPLIVPMMVGLLVVTYVPTLSVGVGGLFDEGKPFYVAFPTEKPGPAPKVPRRVSAPTAPGPSAGPAAGAAPATAPPGRRPLTMQELMREAGSPGDEDEGDEAADERHDGGTGATGRPKSMQELMREVGPPPEEGDDE